MAASIRCTPLAVANHDSCKQQPSDKVIDLIRSVFIGVRLQHHYEPGELQKGQQPKVHRSYNNRFAEIY